LCRVGMIVLTSKLGVFWSPCPSMYCTPLYTTKMGVLHYKSIKQKSEKLSVYYTQRYTNNIFLRKKLICYLISTAKYLTFILQEGRPSLVSGAWHGVPYLGKEGEVVQLDLCSGGQEVAALVHHHFRLPEVACRKQVIPGSEDSEYGMRVR
jgi:hypothetical protein